MTMLMALGVSGIPVALPGDDGAMDFGLAVFGPVDARLRRNYGLGAEGHSDGFGNGLPNRA